MSTQSNKLLHLVPTLALSLLIVLAGLILQPAPVSAQVSFTHQANKQAKAAEGNGYITGKLVDGSNNNAPVGGQTVTLQIAQANQGSRDLATMTTDEQGSYHFDNLATDKTSSYAIYIRYLGVQYVSKLVTLDSNSTQEVDLTVYQTTQSTEKVAVTNANILVHEPDIQKRTITISEDFTFTNLDTRAYAGSLDSSKGKPNALLFSLPAGATNIKLQNGFPGYKVIQVDKGFASDAALLPGQNNEYSFSFDLPYSATKLDLSYKTMYPTVLLNVLVPTDIHASSSQLTSQGVVNSGTDQHPFTQLVTRTQPAQQDITIHLEGLTVTSTNDGPPINARAIWLIVALLAMLGIVGLTWLALRRKQQQLAQPALSRQQTALPTGGKKAARRDSDDTSQKKTDRQQALLKELLELDQDYESKKISKEFYEEKRNRLKARLRALKSEQEIARR